MSDHKLLPDDPFDQALSRLIGLPNGANTQATVVQDVDFYGKTTQFIIQTVRHDEGDVAFLTQVNAAGTIRYSLPSKVLAVLDRQRASVSLMIKRRHGKRLAAERQAAGEDMGAVFRDPAVRQKALVSRMNKAAKRAARRKARKGGRA